MWFFPVWRLLTTLKWTSWTCIQWSRLISAVCLGLEEMNREPVQKHQVREPKTNQTKHFMDKNLLQYMYLIWSIYFVPLLLKSTDYFDFPQLLWSQWYQKKKPIILIPMHWTQSSNPRVRPDTCSMHNTFQFPTRTLSMNATSGPLFCTGLGRPETMLSTWSRRSARKCWRCSAKRIVWTS